jgi:hypothetical protein
MDRMDKDELLERQKIQKVHNPYTGEMMEAKTYSGKELLWKKDMPELPDITGEEEDR